MKDIPSWDLTTQLKEEIRRKGGFVCTHGHFDKAYYISRDTSIQGSILTMEQKWTSADDIKENETQQNVEERISRALDKLIEQGCKYAITFIDGYTVVQQRAIDAANAVKERYKDKIEVKFPIQPIGGVVNPENRAVFEEACSKADIVGGLPSADRPNLEQSMDIMFEIAKNLDKPVHCHIDQENNPNERDTEILIQKTIEHGYQGRVTAVHALSTAAQPKKYRTELYKKMADVGMAVSVNPSAALGMKQLEQYSAPIHNSIANVPEMLEAGLVVGIGVDDVHDFYHPFVDADMWIELRMLMEACRFYDFDALADIASTNGKKIFDIK